MQLLKSTILLAYFFVFHFINLSAQEAIPLLFDTTTTQRNNNFLANQLDSKRSNYLALHQSANKSKADLPRKLRFNLFSDVAIDVELEKMPSSSYKNLAVYRGRSTDPRFAHLPHYRDVVVIYNPANGMLTAQLETNQGAFQISPITANSYQITEWKEEAIDCHTFYERNMDYNRISTSRSGCNEQDANGKYVADLFVGYSYEASVIANDIDAHALSLVEMVNNGLTNSLVDNIYIRLVGTAISEHNPGVVTSVLGNVWTWFADEIALTGADYVASIQVPTGGPNEAGGWAGVGGYSSVNSINNAAGVFRHELGHNVGSNHCTPGILPYASGFNNGNVKTHMCGNNINFYSTPLVNDEMGVPIGDAATADNARVWRERAPIVSARQKHTILFDENDTGCAAAALENGRYYIQNVNSDKYLATLNASNSNGTRLAVADAQASSNEWDLIGVDDNKFRMIHVASGRFIDVPGNTGAAGANLIIWNAHGNPNQIFTISEVSTDIFTIQTVNGQCMQIEDAGNTAADPIEQNACDDSDNTKWRFIPVAGASVLSLDVSTTNVNCYGANNGTATANASGGTGNYTYTWSTGATGTSINNLAPGNYSVTIDDGATDFPFSFSIQQVAPFEVTLTKTQATSLEGANSSATVVVTGGTAPYTYAWSSGATSMTANNLAAGFHDVSITDANNCTLVKEFIIDCPDAFKICDDGNASTYGDHIDINCNCVGKTFTCDNGLAVANVAIGKTATQSSTNGSADASLAIDGNRDGNFGSGSVTATNVVEGVNAWWQVDLKDETDITGILISNRTDCCTGRLEDYHVFVSTTPFTSDDLTTTQNQAGIVYHHYFENATPLPDTLIELNATGRYVRIQSGSDRALHLAEVEIYACGVPTAANITANPLGENNYDLKGYVIPNGATINSISIEHGATDFTNSTNIDLTGIGSVDTFYFTTIVNTGNASNYQFSIKYDTPAQSYATNGFFFTVNSDYCLPTVDDDLWYKRFNRVVLGDITYTDGGNINYEDKTSFSFGEFEMGSSYSIGLTTPSSDWHYLTFLVYVDLNNDGDFTDYNEIVGASPPNGHTTTFSITIPTEDVLVNQDLRMRILGQEGGAFTTCFSPVGNFKDFTIRVKAGACVGTGHLVPFFVDADNDGFGGEIVGAVRNCSVTAVEGYVNNSEDCDDANPNIHPNSEGICDDGIRTISSSISNGSDDVEESGNSGGISTSSTDLELVFDGSNQTIGLRFQNLSIPNNAIITNAYIQFTVDEVSTDATDLVIHAENEDSSNAFLTTAFNVSERSRTTNAVNWIPPSWPTVNAAGIDQQTPNLSALVQEVVNRSGWKTGNPMSFIITGTGERTADSYEGGSAKAPKLYITYIEQCNFYKDNDGDGYGDPNNLQSNVNCAYLFSDYVMDNTDFDDTDKTSHPGAMELCDNTDNNGNGQIDEGASYDTDNMIFTNEAIPTEVYTASQTISTTQTVTVGASADVQLIAGQFINLKSGFSTATGAKFHARIITGCVASFTNTETAAITRSAINPIQSIGSQLNMQISPNPFSNQTVINFDLPTSSTVSLLIYGMNGQVMETIVDQVLYPKGPSSINFRATTQMNGMYYVVLKTKEGVWTEKVVVLGE